MGAHPSMMEMMAENFTCCQKIEICGILRLLFSSLSLFMYRCIKSALETISLRESTPFYERIDIRKHNMVLDVYLKIVILSNICQIHTATLIQPHKL